MIVQANAHIGFICRDLEKSVQFCERIFGMKEKFTLYYGDMIPADPDQLKEISQERLAFLKSHQDTKWIIYMEWPGEAKGYFLELFNETGAHIDNFPSKEKFGFDHFDIVVDDIQEFYRQMTEKGAEEYVDILPGPSLCRGFTMWMHDPDGNPIEIHQYTPLSMQNIGRELLQV